MLAKEGGREDTEGKGQGLKAPPSRSHSSSRDGELGCSQRAEVGGTGTQAAGPAVETHTPALVCRVPCPGGRQCSSPAQRLQADWERTHRRLLWVGWKPRSCWGHGTQQALLQGPLLTLVLKDPNPEV